MLEIYWYLVVIFMYVSFCFQWWFTCMPSLFQTINKTAVWSNTNHTALHYVYYKLCKVLSHVTIYRRWCSVCWNRTIFKIKRFFNKSFRNNQASKRAYFFKDIHLLYPLGRGRPYWRASTDILY